MGITLYLITTSYLIGSYGYRQWQKIRAFMPPDSLTAQSSQDRSEELVRLVLHLLLRMSDERKVSAFA
ncbi:hypothetical protein SAMN05660653_01595 [Desulfonatronum thiosulfatophilum]|uniref:Uncharacterized protein n=1 Tax=Desulfonatronum thiosulfatophilum TaxID=617002 RepID=A0A1G6CKD1_9BACT|nr:hypothetical protein SAMN05660653_01595 [Desulfonatronum thiosulfatophilum]